MKSQLGARPMDHGVCDTNLSTCPRFAITLSTKSVDPTPEGLAEKLRDQAGLAETWLQLERFIRQDLTFAALKMQNCIMDEGLDLRDPQNSSQDPSCGFR